MMDTKTIDKIIEKMKEIENDNADGWQAWIELKDFLCTLSAQSATEKQ